MQRQLAAPSKKSETDKTNSPQFRVPGATNLARVGADRNRQICSPSIHHEGIYFSVFSFGNPPRVRAGGRTQNSLGEPHCIQPGLNGNAVCSRVTPPSYPSKCFLFGKPLWLPEGSGWQGVCMQACVSKEGCQKPIVVIAKKGSQLNQSSGTTTMMVSEPTSKYQHSLLGLW